MTLNELAYQAFSTNSGTTGTLNEVTYAYLSQLTGLSGITLNEQWIAQLSAFGYTTGSINERQMAYWGSLGYSGNWNSRYYQWLTDGGTFGPAVQIIPQGTVPAVGYCEWTGAGTCTATRDYKAAISGFESAVTSWVWSIESGTATITAGQGTDTVTVETQNLDTDETFQLKVIASNADPESAEKTITDTHYHRESLAVVSIASEGQPTASCDYNSTTGGTTCTAIDTYNASITGTPTSYNWILSDVTGAGGAANITGGQGTDTVEVTTTGPTDVGFTLTLDLTSQFQTGSGFDTFTQTHVDAPTPVFIGPDIDTTQLVEDVLMTPFDVSTRFTGEDVGGYSLEGTWPTGVSIDANGVLNGTPAGPPANYTNLTFRASNANGPNDSNIFTVEVIEGAALQPPVFVGPINDITLEVGIFYTFDLRTLFTGDTATYTQETGTLPDVLTLDPSGVISGTPITEDEIQANLSFTATNAAGADTTTPVVTATVWGEIVFSGTIPAQTFTVDSPYSFDASTYFTGTIESWAIGGTWPPGFSIDAAGVITGTATAEGTYNGLSVTASNTRPDSATSNTFNGEAQYSSAPVFLGPDFANAFILQGETYAPNPVAPDRFSPNVSLWSLGGTWPADLVIDPNTGAISGTVTDAVANYFGLTIVAQNAIGTTPSNTFAIGVQASGTAPVWTGTLGPFQWVKGEAITPVQLYADFSSPTLPVTYAPLPDANALPPGITLDLDDGIISGTPTTNDTGSFSVSATNASGTDTTNVATWEVADSFGPTFHALSYDPADIAVIGSAYEMKGVVAGVGDLTTTHTADLYARDGIDGTYRLFGENEPVWSGGRVVRNYIRVSDPRSTGAQGWSGVNATMAPGADDPDGGTNAATITATAANGQWLTTGVENDATGRNVLNSIWIRRRTGTGNIQMTTGLSNSNWVTLSGVDGTWRRFSGGQVVATVAAVKIAVRIVVSGDEVDIFNAQVEVDVPVGASPSEFVGVPVQQLIIGEFKTFANQNGNTVLNNVVTEAIGAPLASTPMLQYYPEATNSCLYSNDLTNAAWVKTTMTAAFDQVGLTGEPNTASLLTATAGNATAIQTVTAVSGTHASKFYLKRSVGTGTVEITVDNVTWTPVTLTADFQSFEVDATVTNPQIGVRIVTSGDAVICGNGEGFLTSTAAQTRGLGPIYTLAAEVPADATLYSFDLANYDAGGEATYMECVWGYPVGEVAVGGAGVYAQRQSDLRGINLNQGSGGRVRFNPNSTLSTANGQVWDDETVIRSAYAFYAGENQGLNVDGVWYGEIGYGGSQSSVAVSLYTNCIYASKIREIESFEITSYQEGKDIIDGEMTIDTQALDHQMQWSVDSGLVTGDSLLVYYGGQLIYRKGFGDIGTNDILQMASATKTVTAAAAMVAVEKGHMTLADVITDYVPEFIGTPVATATVHQVLCHLSGITGVYPGPPEGQRPLPQYTLQQFSLDVANNEFDTLVAPGTFNYSGVGYDVLNRIVEVAVGKAYWIWVQEEIFDALGMVNSSYPVFQTPADPINGGYVNGGGGLRSTLDDYLLLYQMLAAQGGTLLTTASYDEMVKMQSYNAQQDDEYSTGEYGYGLYRDRVNPDTSPQTVSHGGSSGTFPWLDVDTGAIGIFLSQSDLQTVQPLVDRLQQIIRETTE